MEEERLSIRILKWLAVVLAAVIVCLSGIYFIILKGPSPRAAEEMVSYIAQIKGEETTEEQ